MWPCLTLGAEKEALELRLIGKMVAGVVENSWREKRK
jgi:hypothetical protein